jgi:hypothetical protein
MYVLVCKNLGMVLAWPADYVFDITDLIGYNDMLDIKRVQGAFFVPRRNRRLPNVPSSSD